MLSKAWWAHFRSTADLIVYFAMNECDEADFDFVYFVFWYLPVLLAFYLIWYKCLVNMTAV